MLAFDGTMVINPHVFAKMPFDTLKDFAPVGKIGDATLIIVAHPAFAGQDAAGADRAARRRSPRALSYGTSGIGGTPHIAGELLNQRTGSKLVHVPYKGGGQAMTDALGGNIPLVYTAVAGAHQPREGRQAEGDRGVQRASARRRCRTCRPSSRAACPISRSSSWVGILAPAKTPRAVRRRG